MLYKLKIALLVMILQSIIVSKAEAVQLDLAIQEAIEKHQHIENSLIIDYLEKLEVLTINKQLIKSFKGLEQANNLISLRLYNCEIVDFNSLSYLNNLKELVVQNSDIRNISFLTEFQNISHLSLTKNKISDISSLVGCKELSWLDLSYNEITNIDVIKKIDKLLSLDLSNNPLGEDSVHDLVTVIKAKNLNTHIIFQPKTEKISIDISKQIFARGIIAEFASTFNFLFNENTIKPLLPEMTVSSLKALEILRMTQDREYLSDISVILMKYAIEIDINHRPGALLSRNYPHPLVATFIEELEPKLYGDEVSSGAIAYWITNNREKIPPSIILDFEIDRYKQVQIELMHDLKQLK